MKEYHKIITVWKRDEQTNFKTLIDNEWAIPEFEYLKDNNWIWTEKVDGTNMRIMWDGHDVTFGGKTDNAQIHQGLIKYCSSRFYSGAFQTFFGETPVTLYGEGFGSKIQKGGGNYLSSQAFVLFDVYIGLWLQRENIVDIANKFGIEVVPIVGTGTLSDAIILCRQGIKSKWGDFKAEGLVLRPEVELLTRTGSRVITKIKHKDFRMEPKP